MVDFLRGHYTHRMFTPDIDIIPTSLAVALLYRKIHKKSMIYFLLCTHNATQSSLLPPTMPLWFSWIGLSHGWACWAQRCFIQNWRKRSWSSPWWMKGAKCEILLLIEVILWADMMVDVDRQDRTLVRVSRNDLGGDIRACSRLKWSPRNSSIRKGSGINLLSTPKIVEDVCLFSMRWTVWPDDTIVEVSMNSDPSGSQ